MATASTSGATGSDAPGTQLHPAGTRGSQEVNRASFLKPAAKATLKLAVATALAPSGAFPKLSQAEKLPDGSVTKYAEAKASRSFFKSCTTQS